MFSLNSKLFKFAQHTYHRYLVHTSFGPILSKAFWASFTKLQKFRKTIIQKRYATYKMCWQTNESIMHNCIVMGGGRFILQNYNCYVNVVSSNFDLANIFMQYHFQEELVCNIFYDPLLQQIRQPKAKSTIRLKGCWLSLLSTSSTTWMHLLSEYIPVIENVLCTHPNLDFGILYEESLPPQGLECLKIVAGNRRIKAITHNQSVSVETIVIPQENASVYISVWPRTDFIGTGYYAYDNNSLLSVREKIFEHFKITPSMQHNFFVDRESKFRFISNNTELQQFLDNKGFTRLLPAKITLAEQIQNFSQAKLVIIQAGSALANIMFMPSGSKVICMCAKSDWANYAYFIDYAKIFGVELVYLEGSIVDAENYYINKPCSIQHPMNANFYISLEDLTNTLRQFAIL